MKIELTEFNLPTRFFILYRIRDILICKIESMRTQNAEENAPTGYNIRKLLK